MDPDLPAITSRRDFGILAIVAAGGAAMSPFTADIESLDSRFRAIAAAYETMPLAESVPALHGVNETVARMAFDGLSPTQNRQLAALSARTRSLYADALYNAGQVARARNLTAGAARLATFGRDRDALGYARKIRTMIEQFEGHPGVALTIATDGQARAAGTPAGVACMAHHARAAALAGSDPDDVVRIADAAILAAYDLPAESRGAVGGEDPGRVHPVEITYHALIAAANAGSVRAAESYADVVFPALDAMGVTGFAAVAGAHMALLNIRNGDIDTAAAHVHDAVALAPRPFRALAKPLHTWVAESARYADVPGVRDAVEAVRAWEEGAVTA